MRELEYPFDADLILKKKKSIKKALLEEGKSFIDKKIAILGGETTQNIKLILELFLLNYGIRPQFYESEYNRWYEDGMFGNEELSAFAPDLIYICTGIRNISEFPQMSDGRDEVNAKLTSVYGRFEGLWEKLTEAFKCPIIQNNFEYPYFRLMGNKDASDIHGRVNFVTMLNCKFYEYAQTNDNFYICDVNYISASYGLEKWSDPYYYHMYKYALAVPAIPYLSFNVANIIKSLYGKNKKVLNLDMDNTLWGGIIGDDGADNIEIGQETAIAQTYSEFQNYLKMHKQLGVLLTVNSKNDESNALSGLDRPDSVLKKDDFVCIKANWDPKSINLVNTADELSLLPESFVFVDDNPAEREIIEQQVPGVVTAKLERPEQYVSAIDKCGFFEVTALSGDDINRTDMYISNAKRTKLQASFDNYEDYLKSLEMKAKIAPFASAYMARIAQLTNKSNQFNLTTHRYSQAEIETIAKNDEYITLYGKLEDRFGDNGVVSVIIGHEGENKEELHIDLWLMSCRVLKRNMEYAMMDKLVEYAAKRGITRLKGYYYPTAKNSMVKDFYNMMGFTKESENEQGDSVWNFEIDGNYTCKQNVINIDD